MKTLQIYDVASKQNVSRIIVPPCMDTHTCVCMYGCMNMTKKGYTGHVFVHISSQEHTYNTQSFQSHAYAYGFIALGTALSIAKEHTMQKFAVFVHCGHNGCVGGHRHSAELPASRPNEGHL